MNDIVNPAKTFFDEDVTKKLLNDMIKESEYCSKTIKTEFNEPLVMGKKVHGDLKNSTKCWIC